MAYVGCVLQSEPADNGGVGAMDREGGTEPDWGQEDSGNEQGGVVGQEQREEHAAEVGWRHVHSAAASIFTIRLASSSCTHPEITAALHRASTGQPLLT